MEKQNNKIIKLLLLGEQNTGKTSIRLRYCQDNFSNHYIPTYGVDYVRKLLKYL